MDKTINSKKLLAGIHLVVFIIMLLVNYLANSLPINNITTGELSGRFPNLFTPAGFTFAIWGVIYTFLTGFIIFQAFVLTNTNHYSHQKIVSISIPFIISCLANASWIFAWHYHFILTSLVLMLVILSSLTYIHEKLNLSLSWKSVNEKLWLDIPFSIYLGWICIATIANVTVVFVEYDITPLALPEAHWAIIMIIAGSLIGLFFIFKKSNIFFGLVIIWALYGIISKRQMENRDSQITLYAEICMIVIAISLVLLVLRKSLSEKNKS